MRLLLAALLGAFPRRFRRRFGDEVLEQAVEEVERARSRGWGAGAWALLATGWDLVRAGIAERMAPSWPRWAGHSMDDDGKGMTMAHGMEDLRYALRSLRRAPGFAVIAVGTLGLAMGANAGIFSVVDTVLLEPLPFPEPERLVYVAATAPGSDLEGEFGLSTEFLVQYGEATSLESLGGYNQFTSTLRVADRAERVWMSEFTPGVFPALGVAPLLGRLPVEEDERDVAVISHRLWQSWFGGDPEVVGQVHDISGANRRVIGVMGPEFAFPSEDVLLWIPRPLPEEITPGRFGAAVLARMAPGATHASVAAELGPLAARLPERFGGSAAYAQMMELHRPVVRSLAEEMVGSVARPLWVLLGAVGIVLLIACANVANLFAVRVERRRRDLALRRAVGAGRGRLIRTLMTEAGVVALLAGALALVLAWVGVPLFLRYAPQDIPRLSQVGITLPTLAFTFGVAVLAALLCGLVPALRASRPDLARLREGGRGSTGRGHWGRDALVAGQTALALVLLIGSGLLLRSVLEVRNVDPGYDTEDLFTFQIAPTGDHLRDGPSFAAFHTAFRDRLLQLPGVSAAGLVENVPLNEGVSSLRFFTQETQTADDPGTLLSFTWASGDYFPTMGIDVLRGRTFTPDDHTTNLGNVLVSARTAELLFPGEDPLGRRIYLPELEAWQTVVGVVEDVLQYDLRDEPLPMVYFPLVGPTPDAWAMPSPAYVLKTSRAEELAPQIREMVREVAPGAPMYRVFTMEGLARDSMLQLSFTTLTLGVAALLALILGTVGLYGVLSHVVAARTPEIGVRMALGAQAGRVRRMVVGQGVRVVVLGVVVGLVGALLATRFLGTLLFGVAAVDPWTFGGMSVTMLLVGALASWVPARRASSVDPVRSLRME